LPLLAGGVPALGLDGLVVDDEHARLELDPDGVLESRPNSLRANRARICDLPPDQATRSWAPLLLPSSMEEVEIERGRQGVRLALDRNLNR
jgi:hypothetical protein